MADIRLALFSHVQGLSFSFHDRRRTGDILARRRLPDQADIGSRTGESGHPLP